MQTVKINLRCRALFEISFAFGRLCRSNVHPYLLFFREEIQSLIRCLGGVVEDLKGETF